MADEERAPDEVVVTYRSMLASQRQMLDAERFAAKAKSRRWATLVVLLLTLGLLVFGSLIYRQNAIVSDLKKETQRSCEQRNANDALLRSTWSQMRDLFVQSNPQVSRVYAASVAGMKPPGDCSIFGR